MIDTDKYEGHKPAPWVWDISGVGQYESLRCNELEDYSDETKRRIASKVGAYDVPTAELIADAPLLLEAYKRLRHLCDTLFIYAHNIETGQSTIEKSNGEPLSTIDFEKDMTWVNGVNQPKISNIKIGGISYLKIVDDSIHSDGEADYVLATECNAGHLVGEIGYEDCPDCGGEQE